MLVGVPKETVEGELRVALVPDDAKKLKDRGIEVVVEQGAGTAAGFTDAGYTEVGAQVGSADEALAAGVVLKVQPPSAAEIAKLTSGAVLIGFLRPLTDKETVDGLAGAGTSSFAMELVPRITRAQSMDALSSQATVAGYKAVLIGASTIGKFFPMLTTAAGTVRPARVLILGAGVAGLQAIATARRLGAEVEAFDTRPVVKEQVESLGARFVELDLEQGDTETEGGYARQLTGEEQAQQRELVAKHVCDSDVVITTALVPGKPAPLLITADTVSKMKPGSVIVDIAAETGGNCELTEAGKNVVSDSGVTVVGPLNLPSSMAYHASQLYSKNAATLLGEMLDDEGQLKLDFEDEVLAGATVTHGGSISNDSVKAVLGGGNG